jgi:RNA methyltransferase, TrmH family
VLLYNNIAHAILSLGRSMKTITSRQNPLVRAFRELADAPDPGGRRLLLDGVHLVRDARDAAVRLKAVAISATHAGDGSELAALARELERDRVEISSVSDAVMAAMSPVRTPSGIVAIAEREPLDADAICAQPGALVVVAADVQDPGNLGALLRAAEAGGATGVIVCGRSANPFSWKAVRGSMGSALRLPVATIRTPEVALERVRAAGLQSVAAAPRVGVAPDEIDWRPGTAMFLGGEGTGLPASLTESCDARVTIPMRPPVESLNVAVAAALLVYEARRQRT